MLYTLGCYFPAHRPLFFAVEIQSDAWVSQLVGAIRRELQECGQHVIAQDLHLFQTSIPLHPGEDLRVRALHWLRQHPEGELENIDTLTSVFPDGPNTSRSNLHIIVADADVLEFADDLGNPYDAYKRKVNKALEERFNRLPPLHSPSEIATSPSKIGNLLGCKNPPIHLGRPGGVPAAIFNPVLANLQQRLDHLEGVPVSLAKILSATNYLRSAVKFYADESRRQGAIKDIIDEAIGQEGMWEFTVNWADNIKPDVSWWDDEFLIMAMELKNTLGLHGDALLQAILDYSKIVSREKYKRFRHFCNFPIILVGVTANRFEISVAVCVGSILVTKLLTMDLSLGFHASDNIIRLARVFAALSQSRVDLKNYYNRVSNLNSSSPRLSVLYPCPTPIDSSKQLPQVTYQQLLFRGQPVSALMDPGNMTTMMYTATLDGKEVIVKFCARYNAVAHCLLAKFKLAPTLRFCERVVGGLYMVVMDRVDGKSVWELQQDGKPVPAIVLRKAEEAVCLLHKNNYVFGDLRDPNILYVAEDHVVLVDFDWCGRDEQSRYPATLNPDNAWAESVHPYGIMSKDHDLWQLKRLAAICNHTPDA